MPSIPLAAVLPIREATAPVEGGSRTVVQIGAFVIVLVASVVSVLRYSGVLGGQVAPVAAKASAPIQAPLALAVEAPPPVLRGPAAPSAARAAVRPGPAAVQSEADPVTAEVDRIVAALPEGRDRAERLVGEAERALGRGEERLAETLLGRALKVDEKHPRAAFTLARMRFAQNNLEGAEGWVLVAIRGRPRVAEYHSLYADILARQGHSSHARRERAKARRLER
jgi:Flp pilus assembly protein TadD